MLHQHAFGDGVLDAVGHLRAGLGARGIPAGSPDFGEMSAPLCCLGVPLHRGMARTELLDGDGNVAEPAIHRLQSGREIAFAIGETGLANRRAALRVVGEIP